MPFAQGPASLPHLGLLEVEAGGYQLTADTASISCDGSVAALTRTRIMAADAGSVALTGVDATFIHAGSGISAAVPLPHLASLFQQSSKEITAVVGQIDITGIAAGVVAVRLLSGDTDLVEILGTDVVLNKGFTLTADSEAIAINGDDSESYRDGLVVSGSAAVSITGIDAILEQSQNRILLAESGSAAISGTDASLISASGPAADPGLVIIEGQQGGLMADRLLTADSEAITISGDDASLVRLRGVVASSGSLVITGVAATNPRTYVLAANSGAIYVVGKFTLSVTNWNRVGRMRRTGTYKMAA